MELIRPNTTFKFMNKLRYAIGLSVTATIACIALMFYPGLEYSIDFTGGTEIQVRFKDNVQPGDLRAALEELGLPNDSVQRFGDETQHEYIVRLDSATFQSSDDFAKVEELLKGKFGAEVSDFRVAEGNTRMSFKRGSGVSPEAAQAVLNPLGTVQVTQDPIDDAILQVGFGDPTERVGKMLSQKFEKGSFEVVRVDSVGPRVGDELRTQAMLAIIFSSLLVLIYVAFRFETEFAPGAIICLVHDVTMTLGVLVITGSEFSLTTLAAVMTVVGYSLNDTVVVYDRIRENLQRHRRKDLFEIIDLSINETLSRTIITSGTTFLSVIALYVFGGPTVHDFALAMMVGIIVGTYSSIFIAAPTIPAARKIFGITGEDSDEQAEPAT